MSAILHARFGYGAGPGAAASTDAMLAALRAPDRAIRRHPGFGGGRDAISAMRAARRSMRAGEDGARDRIGEARAALRHAADEALSVSLARILDAPDAFRERLVWFWADHFAVSTRPLSQRALMGAYVDEAIRPHVAGRFADLLRAATLHPLMLHYLDATASVGPASEIGMRRGRGLNENHARELLELHTLGADGPYTQRDVTELAELMTGHWVNADLEAGFRPRAAEPGPETVLGRSYGSDPARGGHLWAALDDLAAHPATAAHVCRAIALHFLYDDPPADLLAAMEAAWRREDGALPPVYAALLTHPAAEGPPARIRRPFEWMATALRALGMTGGALRALAPRDLRRAIAAPLRAMGQPFMAPPGPDGWAEEGEAWARPQLLAERIAWAMAAPERLLGALPDPRALLDRALPHGAPPDLAFAASAAESRRDGVGLVLLSPSLMRR